jgi:Leucine-rich repeat (LRR) protein/flagellar hook assembly protein FlgD
MKRIRLFFLLMLIPLLRLSAQIIQVKGNISTSTEVVKNAMITFTAEDDTTKSYTTLTDSMGNYSIGLITNIEENISVIPTKFELAQNYPNPFTTSTAISYKLNKQADVQVSIYDILGREVRKYNIGEQTSGVHGIIWDGKNNSGQIVTTGVYFYRLNAGKENLVNKMILTRGVGTVGSLNLSGNFIMSAELSKTTILNSSTESYKVKIENTDSTRPRIAVKKTENITISEDTTIDFSVNKLPIANAGEDCKRKVGQYVMLDGTKSEVGNGSELTYKWTEDPTNPVIFDLIYFLDKTPVGYLDEGTFKYSLKVNDGIAESDPDDVVVEVSARGESVFEDPVLEIEVRFTLEEPTGELTDEELDSLYILSGYGIFGEVSSLTGIEKCKNLTQLTYGVNNITDLTPLSGLIKLENLALDQNYILSDISPLANLVNIKELDLSSNNISDISALRNLNKLTYLKLTYNPISDISALKDMKELNELQISYPTQGGPLLQNAHVISGFNKLKILWLGELNIDDISFVSTLTELLYIRLSFCNVTDISAISNCTKLVRLYLDSNSITDITGLEGLTDINLLDLNYNQITNIEPLVNNSGLGKGDAVSLRGNPLDEISINQYIPELTKRGVTVFY